MVSPAIAANSSNPRIMSVSHRRRWLTVEARRTERQAATACPAVGQAGLSADPADRRIVHDRLPRPVPHFGIAIADQVDEGLDVEREPGSTWSPPARHCSGNYCCNRYRSGRDRSGPTTCARLSAVKSEKGRFTAPSICPRPNASAERASSSSAPSPRRAPAELGKAEQPLGAIGADLLRQGDIAGIIDQRVRAGRDWQRLLRAGGRGGGQPGQAGDEDKRASAHGGHSRKTRSGTACAIRA